MIWWICCALLAAETVPENRVTFAVELGPLPAGLRLAREPQVLVLRRDQVMSDRLPLPVRVGTITRVRVIGPRPAPRPLTLPFFAEIRPPLLVVSDSAGRKTEFLLGTIRRLEVDSTLPGTVWRPADYLLLGAVTLFSILTYGFFIMVASDD
ncbi:MAG: hypothetical protein CVU65_13480 [Deltaproteobacteria bacterium HGW-Deltaproteobacteria-22]|nr:MAG: hypothetical protein CVU65_13480 [Deltaproteobacteria bacterium HGW-Deltaproteobacteria-22]